MSGVYIKNMPMPKRCLDCWLCYDGLDCVALDESLKVLEVVDDFDRCDSRSSNCPLVSVPDHGDLIDRDVVVARLADWSKRLIETYGENDEYVNCLSEVLEGLNCDDVIIPAERSE